MIRLHENLLIDRQSKPCSDSLIEKRTSWLQQLSTLCLLALPTMILGLT
jgi:hypothetical protein